MKVSVERGGRGTRHDQKLSRKEWSVGGEKPRDKAKAEKWNKTQIYEPPGK